MRIILSHGKVNILYLAKNAGTSVEQIERFYARHLPLLREMASSDFQLLKTLIVGLRFGQPCAYWYLPGQKLEWRCHTVAC